MSMNWSTECRLRRALCDEDEEYIEEILRRDRFTDFEEVKEIFEKEGKGYINLHGSIEYGDLEIRDRFGKPEVRKR